MSVSPAPGMQGPRDSRARTERERPRFASGPSGWYFSTVSISTLQELLADFADRRDWEPYHTPKNLAMALTGEAGELAAEFQWLTEEESRRVMDDPAKAEAVRLEMADVLSYLLRLADVLGVDLEQALRDKVAINERRFPAPERGTEAS
ncbi:NTP pyrophosphatase, house-cleaning of non-canonical NTPs [Marinactinospora thermotolerans DSM 45154]|uniref:NTP pyrophosphatase, house-cleaning of non-canonical NTPs n=1 Tax=Marinactinospora thermotolerans DSM 45154 TaxID=1122192 RepID=A0A1T4TC01_9ACTN|nr:NTP pyrophosphatase, house-cleaning of non-canonical NTPs [Marinactinospora thermotolerans DSM 45154]